MRVYPANTLSRNPAMWQLWAKGFTLEEIGRALGKPASSIYLAAASCGGIPCKAKRRAAKALSLVEREEVSRGIASGLSIRQIARTMGRPASTISREIARNGGREAYRAQKADAAAWRGHAGRSTASCSCTPGLGSRLRANSSATGRPSRFPGG